MVVKKITRRWLINSFGIILFIVLAMIAVVGVSVRNFYYNSVEQYILTRGENISDQIAEIISSDPQSLVSEVVYLVENFEYKSKVELMAIDDDESVLVTSSGFKPDEFLTMPDVDNILLTGEKDIFIGDFGQEKVMAITYFHDVPNSGMDFLGMRYIVSLNQIDNQVMWAVIFACILGLAIIFFVILSSSYFVNALIRPISEMSESTKSIAQGDFNVRLDVNRDDEIGQLCTSINNMAEELSKTEQMKNDFISSVSHELRTPLTAIRGWGETILNEGTQDPVTVGKGVSIIMNETQRLSTMVEELLDFSRMQGGRLQLEITKLDAIAELSDAVLMFTRRAQLENKALKYEEPEYFVPIMGDRHRLRQVFINILDNALKYSDSGDSVTVETSIKNNIFTVMVIDTGVGISVEDLPNVKEKFYKGNTTRRGSGIGLAVADEIISMHQGTLALTSEKNKGSTVTITLPHI